MEKKYQKVDSCNSCGGTNVVTPTETINGHLAEANTWCEECNHQDYWAYGHFESGTEMPSKAEMY